MGDPKRGVSPPTWKLMLVKWLGLFPVLLAVAYAIELAPIDPPIPLKLLMETAVVVPLLNYVITPLMDDLFGPWLYAGVDGGAGDDGGRGSVDIGR